MVKTADELLRMVKASLHKVADHHDWSNHHSFGLDNHRPSNAPDGIYWTGFNDGSMAMAHDILTEICMATAHDILTEICMANRGNNGPKEG